RGGGGIGCPSWARARFVPESSNKITCRVCRTASLFNFVPLPGLKALVRELAAEQLRSPAGLASPSNSCKARVHGRRHRSVLLSGKPPATGNAHNPFADSAAPSSPGVVSRPQARPAPAEPC